MHIAIVSPVWFAVPPSGYGGIEWVVSLLADGLFDAGHDVTLFASGDSHSKAHLSYVFEQAPSEQIGKSLPELRSLMQRYFHNVYMFCMNDEILHTGYHKMAHYIFALCGSKK